MFRMLRPFEPHAYAAVRIVIGFLFMFHGLQKWGLLGGTAVEFGTLRWVAGVIEGIGGPLIMFGFFTVPTAFICSGEMAAAYFLSHQPRGLWPIQNAGELAALYSFAFLYIATRGPGMCSIDGCRSPKPEATRAQSR